MTAIGLRFRVRGSAFWFGVLGSACLVLASHAVVAQPAAEGSCDQFLLAPRQANGKRVGPKSCLMQETAVTVDGRAFARLDVGLDGTVDGYLAKTGDYKEYFTNSPELVFPQTWGP